MHTMLEYKAGGPGDSLYKLRSADLLGYYIDRAIYSYWTIIYICTFTDEDTDLLQR